MTTAELSPFRTSRISFISHLLYRGAIQIDCPSAQVGDQYAVAWINDDTGAHLEFRCDPTGTVITEEHFNSVEALAAACYAISPQGWYPFAEEY